MLKYFSIFIILTIFISACNNKSNSTDEDMTDYNNPSDNRIIEGVVGKKINDNKFAIILDEDYLYKETESPSLNDLLNKYDEVILFSGNRNIFGDDFKEGAKVRIWFDYIRESNPPKSKVLKYQLVE